MQIKLSEELEASIQASTDTLLRMLSVKNSMGVILLASQSFGRSLLEKLNKHTLVLLSSALDQLRTELRLKSL